MEWCNLVTTKRDYSPNSVSCSFYPSVLPSLHPNSALPCSLIAPILVSLPCLLWLFTFVSRSVAILRLSNIYSIYLTISFPEFSGKSMKKFHTSLLFSSFSSISLSLSFLSLCINFTRIFPFPVSFPLYPQCLAFTSMSSIPSYPMSFRASKIYPRRVGRIKWKENIWTRISACSDLTIWLETSSSCKFRIVSAGGCTDLGFRPKCDSIGDEIGADQDWGKLQKNRDRPIRCIRFYRLPFLLPCRGNFYSPSSLLSSSLIYDQFFVLWEENTRWYYFQFWRIRIFAPNRFLFIEK